MHKGPVKQVHTKTGVLQGDRRTVNPEEHHVVDTHLGSPEKRGVLVEQKSEVVVVPVFRVRDQVHAIVGVKGLEAGEQRNFTSGRELCPCQAFVGVGVEVPTRTERQQDHLYVLEVPAFCDLLQSLRRLLKLVSCKV